MMIREIESLYKAYYILIKTNHSWKFNFSHHKKEKENIDYIVKEINAPIKTGSISLIIMSYQLLETYITNIYMWNHVCTKMWNAELFAISKYWKQFKSPSTGNSLNQLWHIYEAEYYTVIKKNDFKVILLGLKNKI